MKYEKFDFSNHLHKIEKKSRKKTQIFRKNLHLKNQKKTLLTHPLKKVRRKVSLMANLSHIQT